MENAVMNCPDEVKVLRPDDREVFNRVWRRVMPDSQESCPIEVETTTVGGDLPCACTCSAQAEEPAMPAAAPVIRETGCPHLGRDFPDTDNVPRLGRASAAYGAQLQQQIMDALECWQTYRCLARRSGGGSCGRMLSALASEKHKTARRLAAAYFLISGVRYWPTDRLSTPNISSYLGMIRNGYQTEQRREQAYRMAAADTSDDALTELYQELADQSEEHSRTLRSILEQSHL